jgi:hypothetical protein
MTLNDIIAEIDEKYPNGLSADSKVRKMDILQKRLYRKMRKQTFQSFSLVTDQPIYPISMSIDNIYDVLVGSNATNQFVSYPNKKIVDTSITTSKYHYFVSDLVAGDFIGIYPTPDDSVDTMVIWYYEEPETLTSTNLNISPSLDPDYHMMFVYYVCQQIAENYRDFDIANGFAIQFNQLESEFSSTFQDPEVILVHSESGW